MGTGSTQGIGNRLNNVIAGNAGDNILNGGGGNDKIFGGAGNDVLNGGSGIDTLLGGAGDDTYIVDNFRDQTNENINAGIDTVRAPIHWTLRSNSENLTLLGTNAIDGTGNELNNVIIGNAANNILSGVWGDDTLIGGGGIDKLYGGSGNDTYIVENPNDQAIEVIDSGIDTVQAFVGWVLGASLENLTLLGTASINGIGNALNNTIIGNAGDNFLDGGGSSDSLSGGVGNDTYIVDADDTVTELPGAGIDIVRSTASLSLGANLENLILIGPGNLSGIGNELNNEITGNAGDNFLDGSGGSDSLNGGAGNDTYLVDGSDTVTELPARRGD
ncbi:calcium-binding protein [Leptolyngbya sp. FACHB-261]|uniref:calcium-binding protein n=1 Tax=Leptolyngbya sp. FACHB-261 TaxID=2692806 RepID=UPI001684CF41|nr:calcium-binding protein [Leptolyngbya sp. FACHB-261]MBD2102615.1 hypothetical protein [Leptolyngbya sp. FACHB-261]